MPLHTKHDWLASRKGLKARLRKPQILNPPHAPLRLCIYIKMPAFYTLLIGRLAHHFVWLDCFRAAHRWNPSHGWAPGLDTLSFWEVG